MGAGSIRPAYLGWGACTMSCHGPLLGAGGVDLAGIGPDYIGSSSALMIDRGERAWSPMP